MLSWTENKTVHMAAISAQGCSRDVCVQRVEQEQALAAAGEALRSGCVGLIVNTVKRAQMLREELRQDYPDAVILMDHSRFLAPDRLEHEQEILRCVGKSADAQTRRGVLVIGTQVLEALEDQTRQSLPLWLQAPMLEGELFLILDADGTAQLAGKTLRYDPQVGLTEEEETHGTNGIQSAG